MRIIPDGIPKDVCDTFEALALQAKNAGFDRYSAYAILQQVRWHHQIVRGNREFKCNNNWTPTLSRWAMEINPVLTDFFELRELKR